MTFESSKQKLESNLQRRLSDRPKAQELMDRNILKEELRTLAPSLAGPAEELEKAHKMDVLSHMIENRPDKESLVQHNILKDYSGAPALASASEDLKKAVVSDMLAHKIEERPSVETLVKSHILKEGEVGARPMTEKAKGKKAAP